MQSDEVIVNLLASKDPHNVSEYMQITIANNASLVFKHEVIELSATHLDGFFIIIITFSFFFFKK